MRFATRLVALAAMTTIPLGSGVASAQIDSTAPRSEARVCWRGHPLPRCSSFWLTEVSGEYALATTTTRYRYDYTNFVNEYDRRDISNRLIWTIGPMFNTSPSGAVGGTVSGGFTTDGSRIAIEARRRWWASDDGSQPTFDLSAGLLRLDAPPPQGGGAPDAYGLTGGLYFIGGDLVQVNARADLLLTNGRVRAGATVGAGLGSYAAAGATAIAGLLVVAVIVALARNTNDF